MNLQWFTTSSEDYRSSGVDDNEPSENQDADLIDSDHESDAGLEVVKTHLNRCTPNPKWRKSYSETPLIPVS